MNRLRILLVEDHNETLTALSKLLRLSGHDVQTATSADEAMAVCAKCPCDLLVSDIGLPGRSGADLMRDLRAMYPVRGIAMTAFGEAHMAEACFEAGFSRHITKPVAFSELLEAIQEVSAEPASG
jgi:CheY-like chemotaxis protein